MLWHVVGALFLLYLFNEFYWKRRNLPPGPLPLPLIGNSLTFFTNSKQDNPMISVLQKWKNEYGSIYTYWFGGFPIVTVNDMETIQEMFITDGDNYSDRAPFAQVFADEFRDGHYGVIETSGHLWREQRRFSLHTLRNIGWGRKEMQDRILLEAEALMDRFEEDAKNGPVTPMKYLDQTVCSVINVVLFGFRFDEKTSHEFRKIRDLLDKQVEEISNPIIFLVLDKPWIRDNIPFIKRKFDIIMESKYAMFDFFRRNIEEHKKWIDYDSEETSDYCEAYLKEIKKQENDPDTTFHEKQLIAMFIDLWLAGMETTSSTMAWGVVLLLNHPEVLSKMHDEFDRVIGEERLITIEDKTRLPYTNAVICEVQRWANIVPQNLLRRSSRGVTVKGHTIPAGTVISPQISLLLFDPEVFLNPEKFDPARFLDEKGNLSQSKQFLPFSVGKRQCLGEGLARMELFLFFSNIAHRFEITPVKNQMPTMNKIFSSASKPAPYCCDLKKRIMKKSEQSY